VNAEEFEPAWNGSGLEDPRYFTQFEAQLNEDWDQGGQDDGYGIKVLFVAEGDDEKRQGVLMPWLTTHREHARMMVHLITTDASQSTEILKAWLSTGDVELETDIMWHPIAAKVVHLAVVPF